MTEADGKTSLEYLFNEEELKEFLETSTLETKERMLQKVKHLLHINYWLKIRGVPIWGFEKDTELVKLRKKLRKAIYNQKLEEEDFYLNMEKIKKEKVLKQNIKNREINIENSKQRVDEGSKRKKRNKTSNLLDKYNNKGRGRVKFDFGMKESNPKDEKCSKSKTQQKHKNSTKTKDEHNEEEEYVNHMQIRSINDGYECKYHVTVLPSDEYDYYEEEDEHRIYMTEVI